MAIALLVLALSTIPVMNKNLFCFVYFALLQSCFCLWSTTLGDPQATMNTRAAFPLSATAPNFVSLSQTLPLENANEPINFQLNPTDTSCNASNSFLAGYLATPNLPFVSTATVSSEMLIVSIPIQTVTTPVAFITDCTCDYALCKVLHVYENQTISVTTNAFVSAVGTSSQYNWTKTVPGFPVSQVLLFLVCR